MTFAVRHPVERRSWRLALVVGLAVAGLLTCASEVDAQRYRGSVRVRTNYGIPDVHGEFSYCRLQYTSVRSDGSGGGWDTDMPEGERNFMFRLPELTLTRVSRWSHGEAGYTVVRATDPDLFRCPFIMATDVGELGFMPDEIEPLRDYFAKGGFFWADDFWGTRGWQHFSDQLQRLLPDHRLVELTPATHPLFHTLYVIDRVPQIPSIQHWRNNGGETSELGRDSAIPSMWAMVDEDGHIAVLITHNTDISDGWEREAYDDRFFVDFSPPAYAIGMNVILWAMSR